MKRSSAFLLLAILLLLASIQSPASARHGVASLADLSVVGVLGFKFEEDEQQGSEGKKSSRPIVTLSIVL